MINHLNLTGRTHCLLVTVKWKNNESLNRVTNIKYQTSLKNIAYENSKTKPWKREISTEQKSKIITYHV
jgi:hypothetical protein